MSKASMVFTPEVIKHLEAKFDGYGMPGVTIGVSSDQSGVTLQFLRANGSSIRNLRVEDADVEDMGNGVIDWVAGILDRAYGGNLGGTRAERAKRFETDSLSWWQHIRRYSVAMYLAIVGLNVASVLPEVVSWLTGNKALWVSLLTPGEQKVAMIVLAIAGIYVRKIRQKGLE